MKFSDIKNDREILINKLLTLPNQYSINFKDTKCECLGFKYNTINNMAESYVGVYQREKGYWKGSIYYSDRVKRIQWGQYGNGQLYRKVIDEKEKEKETKLHMVHPELLIEKDNDIYNIYCYLPSIGNIKLWYSIEWKLIEFGMFIDQKIFVTLGTNREILTTEHPLHYFIYEMINQFESNDQCITNEIKLNSSETMESTINNIEKLVWSNLEHVAYNDQKLPKKLTHINKCVLNDCCKVDDCYEIDDCCEDNDCC